MTDADPTTWTYRAVLFVMAPVMRPWSRLVVRGLDTLPASGPVLLVANHDSYWDPVAIGAAARGRRQVRALSKSSLWRVKPIGTVMTGMGHIPIERGTGDLHAMDEAVRQLRDGVCIGIFPEGTRSLGRTMRARTGAGRLALAVAEAEVVCVRVTGTTDVVRLPRRPRITVEFFRPAGGRPGPGETAAQLSERWLQEIRAGSPPAVPGRHRTAAKYRTRLVG